jgi:DNA polymerase/3'-5' exonuclease PolX
MLVAEDRLTEIPGVGDAIADIITKIHKTGSHPSLEKLRKEIPAGVLEMLAVPGLRPEKVLRLYKDLGIGSLSELEAAAKGRPHQEGERTRRRATDQDPAEPRDRQKRRRPPPPALARENT